MTEVACQTFGEKKPSLGIFTKSHVKLKPQGLQRLHDFILQDQSAKLLPAERVSNCLKKRIDKKKNRNVMYNESRQKMHYGNVQRCGSQWICPVCAKKLTESKREDLSRGLKIWRAKGNHVYLMTMTFSHHQGQPLKFLLDGQKSALKIFHETTKVQEIFKSIGLFGKIRGMEVTYGKNGWHPHNHFLLFSTQYLSIAQFDYVEKELGRLWIKACIRAGLNAPSMKYGLDLRDGSYADTYIAKWGLEQELTKGHIKKGRNGSFTPFDLLQKSINDEIVFGRDASKLWQEFGIAIKGSTMLFWGHLKKKLGMNEVTDQEIMDQTDKESIEVYDIPALLFFLLNKYQKRHVFIERLENDWKNDCFGSGTAEQLIVELIELEESKLDEFDDKYYSQILRIMA